MGRPTAAELERLGQQALDRVSARLVGFFLVTVMAGIFVVGLSDLAWMVRAELAAVGCLVLEAVTLAQSRSTLWLCATIVVGGLTVGVIAHGSSALTRPDDLHNLVAWTVGGVAGGVCAARGPAWGLAALGVTAVADVAAERAIGGAASAYVFVGPAAYYFGTAAVNLVARRGFAATERALSAAEAATTAQLVADQRWRAARQVDRQLHDTVLATLTVLAHGGIGLSAEQIRAACERDVRLLTRTDVVDPRTPTVAVTGVAASLRLAVDRAVDDAVAAGLQVRVYGDIGHAVVHDVAAGALGAALHECLTNAHRHAAAGSVDVTTSVADGSAFVVVVDDGAGFDVDQIERDRLGLRVSVQERLREVGGDAIIWSRPGRGTSVLLRVPEVAG